MSGGAKGAAVRRNYFDMRRRSGEAAGEGFDSDIDRRIAVTRS